MNRTEKKQIDDLMRLNTETYQRTSNSYDRYQIFMSDIRDTKISEDLKYDTDIFDKVKTAEQKSYFVNKMNEKMLKRRNDYADDKHDDYLRNVVIDSDILYHSIDDFFKHGCFLRDKQHEMIQAIHTNALNQIEKLQNVDETDFDLELHDFLEVNQRDFFNELERYQDSSKDVVKERSSVKLYVPAIILAHLYKRSGLLDFTKKESESS